MNLPEPMSCLWTKRSDLSQIWCIFNAKQTKPRPSLENLHQQTSSPSHQSSRQPPRVPRHDLAVGLTYHRGKLHSLILTCTPLTPLE